MNRFCVCSSIVRSTRIGGRASLHNPRSYVDPGLIAPGFPFCLIINFHALSSWSGGLVGSVVIRAVGTSYRICARLYWFRGNNCSLSRIARARAKLKFCDATNFVTNFVTRRAIFKLKNAQSDIPLRRYSLARRLCTISFIIFYATNVKKRIHVHETIRQVYIKMKIAISVYWKN